MKVEYAIIVGSPEEVDKAIRKGTLMGYTASDDVIGKIIYKENRRDEISHVTLNSNGYIGLRFKAKELQYLYKKANEVTLDELMSHKEIRMYLLGED